MTRLDKFIFWLIRRLSANTKRAILSSIEISVEMNVRNKHDKKQIFQHAIPLYQHDLDTIFNLSEFLYILAGEYEALTPVIFWNHPVNELKDFRFRINTEKLGRFN